ncbi:unnamed protein product [Moneuplotes crassus]|uniref:Uncharacterized protein n=1 Tax=Euplotes crassus TaxID=5936 RepID=A0AAD1X6H3_EUPCR|nr:unnamed protein product [Moneuplotes crassus]
MFLPNLTISYRPETHEISCDLLCAIIEHLLSCKYHPNEVDNHSLDLRNRTKYLRSCKATTEVSKISSFLNSSGNLHEQIGSPSNTSTEDSIIQAFEKGFLKNATREVLNNKLRQIKEGNNTKEAIKDVLEFTVKSKKDQFIDELKLLEGRLGSPQKNRSFLKFPVARRTRDRSCHSPEYMTGDSPSKIKIHN